MKRSLSDNCIKNKYSFEVGISIEANAHALAADVIGYESVVHTSYHWSTFTVNTTK